MLAIDKNPSFCTGDSVVVHVSGAKSYLWNDGTKRDSIVIKYAGEYIVTGTSDGCISTLAFTAALFDSTQYTIQTDRDQVTNDNIPIHLWSQEVAGSVYYWDFDDGKTDQGNDISHIYDITRDGYYDVKLRVVNVHGCVQNLTKRIWIAQSKLPNVFTPNGDGKNDIFMKNWKIQVYNRNGILIYEGKDGWDGTRNGKPVSNDTYFYVVYYSTETGTKTNTGFVTVIR
jgi:gliding motility-associated-like protein